MDKAANFYHLRIFVEDKEALEKCGPALFALEPHDVLPLSIFAYNDTIRGFSGHRLAYLFYSLSPLIILNEKVPGMPDVPYLSSTFDAPCIHLGQCLLSR